MDGSESIKIPRRPSFRSSEVCQIVGIKPYVLRSWEQEFADLGKANGSGSRVYRRSDVDRVLRIKQLTCHEGLTLAGARRRLEEEQVLLNEGEENGAVSAKSASALQKQLTEIETGLRSILEMLGKDVGSSGRSMSTKRSRQKTTSRRMAKKVKRTRTRR